VQTLLDEALIRDLNARFETAEPQEILAWALDASGLERVCVASAFQAEGTAVIHMAAQIRPEVPILFLETGFHFAETLAFKQRLRETLGLNVVDLTGDYTVDAQTAEFGPRLYERNPKLCCELNKVIPFNRALRHYDAWVTSMRRDSSGRQTGRAAASFASIRTEKKNGESRFQRPRPPRSPSADRT
jgi:phosphoadenosine phosphosulfate reductase